MMYGRELPGYPYNLKAILTRCLVAARREFFGRYLASVSSHAPLVVGHGLCGLNSTGNDLIREAIEKPAPFLLARFGCGEMEATLRGIDVQSPRSCLHKVWRMITGEGGPFWWDNSIRAGLCWNAGFFPPTDQALNAFSRKVCEDCAQIDILGSYLPGEKQMKRDYAPNMKGVLRHFDIEPFFWGKPWSMALRKKRVLVVHPFVDTIRAQYEKRRLLFKNPETLPDFQLETYRTLSSFAGNRVPYETWFDALDKMCSDIAKLDFDVAIIGCGAYGMSIGAYIKRNLKKKALHLGGTTQLLFGIKGGRWDAVPKYSQGLYNEHWVRPFASDTVAHVKTIEGGCYW